MLLIRSGMSKEDKVERIRGNFYFPLIVSVLFCPSLLMPFVFIRMLFTSIWGALFFMTAAEEFSRLPYMNVTFVAKLIERRRL
ncbi:MAG: hypothetical protein BAA00_05165 [Parageobacillus thermoglucosidasius]|nr:hypothetical protein [Parageobacillus thermoglucosidasius]OUM91228.1 MAG: hypothetical protein BAA00_05165 [Parageobacillus thermoglucosidasius]